MDPVIEEIRRRADIVEIVEEYVSLVPAGAGRWKACCPFHAEKTPSFYVSRDKGFFKCFGCLEENEPIWTHGGLKRIAEVAPGECVLDRDGQWRSVLAVEHKRGPLLGVSTRAFRNDPLKLTPDHTCLWVKREDALASLPYLYLSAERGVRFKSAHRRFRTRPITITQGAAEEMRTGDFLLFPVVPDENRSQMPLAAPQVLAPYRIGKKTRRLDTLPVSVSAARLYGLYLAEGSTHGRSVFWTFHINESSTFGQQVVDILRDELGLCASIHLHPHKNTCSVICSKVDLVAQLNFWFGKGCAHKRLPSQVLEWPVAVQQSLLQGYRDGDGDWLGRSVSVSRELSYGLFALCIQAGELPSLSSQDAYTDSKQVAHRRSWHLLARVLEGLGGWFQEIDGQKYFWSAIKDIGPLEGEHAVVDISVAGSASFVTKLGATHNCGQAGDLFKFVGLSENMPFGEVKRKLAERYGIALRERSELTPEQQAQYAERDRLLRVTSTAASWFREQLTGNAGNGARDYARTRRLKRETLEAFGIGYAPDAWDACTNFLLRKFGFSPEDAVGAGLLIEKDDERGKRHYDRYRHRLMFPIWDERGAVIAFGGRALEGGNTGTPEAKYINSPEGPLFKKARTLYAWHLAKDEVRKRESLIVTEGYMDAIALHAAGFANTVATLGTSLTQEHAKMLRRVQPKTVFLCFDGDGAGMKAALRAGPLFDSLGLAVRVVRLPQEHDPDTFIRDNGAQAFEQVLADAPPLAQYRIEHALSGASFETVAGRSEAQAQAARVIAEIGNESERAEYIARLAHQVAVEQNAMERLALIEASLQRQVRAAQSEIRRDQSNQRRREEERRGVEARLREKGDRGEGEVINLPRRDGSANASDAAPKYLGRDENGGEQSEVLEFTPRLQPKEGGWSGEKRERGEWKSWKDRKNNEEEPHNKGGSGGTDEVAARLLSGVATGEESGAVKAEKALLHAMLCAPSRRASLIEQIAPALWTREVHFEVVAYLKTLGEDEPLDPPRLFEEISPEAGQLCGVLLMEEAPTDEPEVLLDYIRIVELHHARRREHEVLQLIIGKLSRGEDISPQEREQYAQAARATGRKKPPEA